MVHLRLDRITAFQVSKTYLSFLQICAALNMTWKTRSITKSRKRQWYAYIYIRSTYIINWVFSAAIGQFVLVKADARHIPYT